MLRKKVAIIGAMEQEIAILRKNIKNIKQSFIGRNPLYKGQIEDIDVLLLQSGIGKTAAAMGTALLLDRYCPDIVINTGSAGALSDALNPGDIVISTQVRYHDVDLTAFGYEPGQMAACEPAFTANRRLIEQTEVTIKNLVIHAVKGLIISGDSFIQGGEALARIRLQFPDAIALDMEAAAIAHVCQQFSTPFVVIRAISDKADNSSALNFDAFLEMASRQSSSIVLKLLKQFEKGKEKEKEKEKEKVLAH